MPRDPRQSLGGDALRLLALLDAYPGSRISVDVAAAVFGTGAARAARLLEELSEHGLVESTDPARGWWSGHDLDPTFSRVQQLDVPTSAGGSVADRHAMLTRVTRMFLRQAVTAEQALDPFRARLGSLYQAPSRRQCFPVAEAVDWFQVWHRDLGAVQAAAFTAGLDAEVWQLAEALITTGERFRTPPSRDVFDRAVTAAERLGEAAVWCRMIIVSHMHQRRAGIPPMEAGPNGWSAYADRLCAAAVGADVVTRGWCLRELGQAWLDRGSHHAALSLLSRSRDVLSMQGADHEAAITRWSIADAVSASGHDAKAVPELHLAAKAFSQCGDLGRAAASQVLAAYAFYRLGRGTDALTRLDGCIPVLRDTCFPREEALAHALYATLHPHREHAGRHAEQARELASRLHLPPRDPLQKVLEPPE